MSEFPTVQVALAYLDNLGSSEAIATELASRKIKSKPGCPDSCALADFLSESVAVYSVSIDGDHASGYYGAEYQGDNLIPVHWFWEDIPVNVQNFITDFDMFRYSDLVVDGHPIHKDAV